ncbi:hypothetical protein MRX96_020300 [Rhipicephalus microplus]
MDNERRVEVLSTLANNLEKGFEDIFTTLAVPYVKQVTSTKHISQEMDFQGDALPEVEEQILQPVTPGITPEEYIARYLAERVAKVYHLTINDTVDLARKTCALATDFSRMLKIDADKTATGFDKLEPALEEADTLGVMKTLRSESKSYVAGIVGSFSVLFILYSGSFIMGMFYYNEGVAPTKRR